MDGSDDGEKLIQQHMIASLLKTNLDEAARASLLDLAHSIEETMQVARASMSNPPHVAVAQFAHSLSQFLPGEDGLKRY